MLLEKINNILDLKDFDSFDSLSFDGFEFKDYKSIIQDSLLKINIFDKSLTHVYLLVKFINLIHQKMIFKNIENFHFNIFIDFLEKIDEEKEESNHPLLSQIRYLIVDCLSNTLSIEKLNFYNQETEKSILKAVLKFSLNAPFIYLLHGKGLDFNTIEGQNPYYYTLKNSTSVNFIVETLYNLNIPLPHNFWSFVFKEISTKKIKEERDFLLKLPQQKFIVDESTNESVWNFILKNKSYNLIDYLHDDLYKPHTVNEKSLAHLILEINDLNLIKKLGMKIFKLSDSHEEIVSLLLSFFKSEDNRKILISEFLDKFIICSSKIKYKNNAKFIELQKEWNNVANYSILNPISLIVSLLINETKKNEELTLEEIHTYKETFNEHCLDLDKLVDLYTSTEYPKYISDTFKNYLNSLPQYEELAHKQKNSTYDEHDKNISKIKLYATYNSKEFMFEQHIFEDVLSKIDETNFSSFCDEALKHLKTFKFNDTQDINEKIQDKVVSTIDIFSISDEEDDEDVNVFLEEEKMRTDIEKIEKLGGASEEDAKYEASRVINDLKIISKYPLKTPSKINENSFLSLLKILETEDINDSTEELLNDIQTNFYKPIDNKKEVVSETTANTNVENNDIVDSEPKVEVEKEIEIELFSMDTYAKFKKDNDGGNNDVLNTFFKKYPAHQYKFKSLATASNFLENIDKLYETFPHFESVIKHIENFMVLQDKGDKSFYIPPLLLGGGPGVGKTFFCHTVSKLVNTHFELLNMESMTANFILTGSNSQWRDATPGKIFKSLFNQDYKNMNPIFLLDELEKAGGDSRYGVMNSLLPLLERYTAKKFKDECIPLEIDASYIVWFATANDLDKLTAPIRSRFDILSVPNPTPNQRKSLIKGIYDSVRANNTWGQYFDETLPNESLDILANLMAPGAARDLRKSLTMACSKAIREESRLILPNHIERYENGETMPWVIIV